MIKIEDNGLGFKENEKQKIFLPFYSLKKEVQVLVCIW